jgi:hypothetical protein
MSLKLQEPLLEFCKGGKTTIEICNEFKLAPTTVHRYMQSLRNSNHIKKIEMVTSYKGGQPCLFVTVGTTAILNREFMTVRTREEPKPEPIFNLAFIRAAHNPFNIGSHHG